MSLARIFGTLTDNVPDGTPYLRAAADISGQWRSRLGHPGKMQVGLVWSSGIRDKERSLFFNDVSRSMPLAFLAPLARISGVDLHSLQVGDPALEAKARPHGLKVKDWQSELRDFSETAGLIDNLDLVITVDTAVAHLAGAMGKPVWMLMKPVQCWRWTGTPTQTPWYPTMRIFRQQTLGDWSEPINSVSEELARMAGGKTRPGLLAAIRRTLFSG